MLFVQSFQRGSIVPLVPSGQGKDARYTLMLEAGLGQTIYFSDRPDRLVGATPTDRFLAGLGFPADNPPNAALVVETAPGETDIAVVELFNPVFDPAGPDVTYDVAVLANWQSSLKLGFTAAPTDLATLAPSFGAAHLFIDDCPNNNVGCWNNGIGRSVHQIGYVASGSAGQACYSARMGSCLPCDPWLEDPDTLNAYWSDQCNRKFSDCSGRCAPFFRCEDDNSLCYGFHLMG